MVFHDQTPALRALLDEANTRAASASTSISRSRSRSRPRSASRARGEKGKEKDQGGEFLVEAYRIHEHLISLGSMLKSIRKPYLSTEPAPRLAHPRTRNDMAGGEGEDDELKKWEGSKYLSERERDEIELRAKMILRRCRDRLSALEAFEKARHAKEQPSSSLYTYLPSLTPVSTDTSEPLVSAHRASVIWTLTSLLARLSASQMEMQEERAKRRAEKSKTLGAGAAREAAAIQLDLERRAGSSYTAARDNSSMGLPLPSAIVPTDEPSIESQLSPEQLQQFESENSHLLREMESQLTSVLAAEKSLLEISAIQTELVRQLVSQTEITDRLYDEAVGSVAEMGKANEQLKKAKERSGEARMFLLMFLVGASMALLFLDWYA